MSKRTRHYFIPCIDNEFKPHFFREKSVGVLSIVIIALFLSTSAVQYSISINSSLFATVISAVLVDLTNEDRMESAISPLTIHPLLTEAAQLKANDMAARSYFAHTSPEGVTPWFWFEAVGYPFTHAGENLAVHFSDSEDVENAWMNSPGHRANILNDNFTEIGIATAHGIYEGRETTFVVQLFGRSSVALASTASVVEEETVVAQIENAGRDVLAEESRLEVIEESETFIAVENTEETREAAVAQPTSTLAGKATAIPYASFVGRIFSSPTNMLSYAYVALGAIISIALLLMVFIEIRRQHLLHIAYALSLLVLIVGLYTIQSTLFPEVLVIAT